MRMPTRLTFGPRHKIFDLPRIIKPVVEDNGPAQPVLRLSKAVDCCSTISVWVLVQELDAKRKY